MATKILLELEKYQYERGEESPFNTHIEFSKWADSVEPLLSFDEKLQNEFKQRRRSANATNKISPKDCANNINACIGVVNKAIKIFKLGLHNNNHPKTSTSTNPLNPINDIYDLFFTSNYRVKLILFCFAASCFFSGVYIGQSALYTERIAPIISLIKKNVTEEKKTTVPNTPKNITELTNMNDAK